MIDQATARALCEAGYIPVSEYLRMVSENGWKPARQNTGYCRVPSSGMVLTRGRKASLSLIQSLSAASRRGARVRKLLKAFREAFLRHKGEPPPKMVKMYRQGRRPKDLLADMRKSGSRIS